ncbi:sigma-E factor negative regulatory protein [Wenzhouxiangella marina]|uniref:Anti sigma-E protein RseA N-terminal domain-containing protein n=1 Tax=Wenzhouxiangella marina TaxID=1579979 RepID=A0A0K0XXP1_9GAMM|nr:sigma-E factor negative regulatory protein [Wenzhouxiangella marina]AKS42445.1 hypothetical protein WM2015_2080 [Wenzhouxiangella marina]MBB6085780.1 sigma-E factor negative regulatory protein RseA [Wenzhouxiangella marina]
MSDSTEHLSSLMDGELDAQGREFVLRRLSSDAGMSATWRRYHLVRACMHQEFTVTTCIVDRVSAAVAEESAPGSAGFPRWFKPLAGGAIAASAALFAIVAINSSLLQRNQSVLGDDQPGFVAQPTVLDQPFSQQPVPVSFSEISPAERQRINSYLLRHNQAVGGSGFVSYLPIVTGQTGERIDMEPLASGEATPLNQDVAEQDR